MPGTNGEFYALSFEEKRKIAAIIIEETQGVIPVYVGVGCISTAETIRLAREMEKLGADALSVITPYFLSFSQKNWLIITGH